MSLDIPNAKILHGNTSSIAKSNEPDIEHNQFFGDTQRWMYKNFIEKYMQEGSYNVLKCDELTK